MVIWRRQNCLKHAQNRKRPLFQREEDGLFTFNLVKSKQLVSNQALPQRALSTIKNIMPNPPLSTNKGNRLRRSVVHSINSFLPLYLSLRCLDFAKLHRAREDIIDFYQRKESWILMLNYGLIQKDSNK